MGGALARQCRFDRVYNSQSIEEIAGEHFDLVVCAGAPATMWAANARPAVDAANLCRLFKALCSAKIGRVILISTIAVFDDSSAGYTETCAKFEVDKAYGRNRRELELRAMEAFDCHVVRLPALFGPGLKKNFIFDLMNPIPSFVVPAKLSELQRAFPPSARKLLDRAFAFDGSLGMWRFDRGSFPKGSPEGEELEAAFRRTGFLSTTFTNSRSLYQFYCLERLVGDIDRCVESGIRTLNICSMPLSAAEIHREMFGEPFENDEAPCVAQDVRTQFASLLGGRGPYLYTRDQVLADLSAFVSRQSNP